MYYSVSFYAKEISFVIREEDIAALVSEVTENGCTLSIIGYISEDQLPDNYILLTPHC